MEKAYYIIQYRKTDDIIKTLYTKGGLYEKKEEAKKTARFLSNYPELYIDIKIKKIMVKGER